MPFTDPLLPFTDPFCQSGHYCTDSMGILAITLLTLLSLFMLKYVPLYSRGAARGVQEPCKYSNTAGPNNGRYLHHPPNTPNPPNQPNPPTQAFPAHEYSNTAGPTQNRLLFSRYLPLFTGYGVFHQGYRETFVATNGGKSTPNHQPTNPHQPPVARGHVPQYRPGPSIMATNGSSL